MSSADTIDAPELIDFGAEALRRDPYPTFHRLRREDPVHFRPAHGDWVLTRYGDVASVLRDARFVPRRQNVIAPDWRELMRLRGAERLARMFGASERLIGIWMVSCNPPDHTRLRALIAPAFTTERIAAMRPLIEATVEQLLERAVVAGECELMSALAFPLPVAVIAHLVGVPVDRRIEAWSRDVAALLDTPVDAADRARGLLAVAGFAEYLRRLVDAREASGGVLDALIAARDRGELHDDEVLATATLLLFAGHETTRHLIGGGVLALLRHPAQMTRLRAKPELMTSAVEEFLRYDTPGQLIWRVAAADVQIDGRGIRQDQAVRLLLGAANRDPARFPDPDRLDLDRHPNPHLAFGGGIHHCPGAALARLEAAVAIGAVLRRWPRLALASEPEWGPTFRLRGLRSLRLAV
jgi:cytochrome P450